MGQPPEQRDVRAGDVVRPATSSDEAAIDALLGTACAMPDPAYALQLFGFRDERSARYLAPRAACFVCERGDALVGVAGIVPLPGARAEVCELRDLAVAEAARRQGIGSTLVEHCLVTALAFGYRHCYTETLRSLQGAQRLFAHHGYSSLSQPVGRTGRHLCDRWYLRDL